MGRVELKVVLTYGKSFSAITKLIQRLSSYLVNCTRSENNLNSKSHKVSSPFLSLSLFPTLSLGNKSGLNCKLSMCSKDVQPLFIFFFGLKNFVFSLTNWLTARPKKTDFTLWAAAGNATCRLSGPTMRTGDVCRR